MRNIVLLLFFFYFGLTLLSQTTKGRMSYDMIMTSDDPQTSAYISNMEGSTMELYFGQNKIRSEMYLGDFMTIVSIAHKSKDTTLSLTDGMMGKIATKSTLDDMEDEERLAITERRIDLMDETKEIMGYTCKKAIITTPDDNESIVWYTPEIVPEYRSGQFLYEEIPGVPMMMTSTWGKMDIVMKAFEFKKKLKKPDKLFSMEIPKGYTIMTPKEVKEMRTQRGR